MPDPDAGSPRFLTTHWSVVLAAGAQASQEKRDALAALCHTYWYPLYAFARRQGTSPDMAQDLVTSNAFRVALHRLRRRYRDALREEVAQTLSYGRDVEDELQELLAALAI